MLLSGTNAQNDETQKGRERIVKNKAPKFWVAVALILCLISMIGASLVQSSGNAVTVKELSVETESGMKLDALLFIPKTATRETPAPAVVTSHGWFNNKEMMEGNYVELARRGFVVMSISMYGHGDSDIVHNSAWWDSEHGANGMYDAVKIISTLPYVDISRIGVTGHSNGGLACKVALDFDNAADKQLISSVLLICCDPKYTVEDTVTNTFGRRTYDFTSDTFFNHFGSRDAGVIAPIYDEFFYCESNGDGTWTPAWDYIHTTGAQSFLYFGNDPAGLEERANDTYYTENIDGKDADRIIFVTTSTHPGATFDKDTTAKICDYFDRTLDAPNPIDGTNQIWGFKQLFNALGVVGLAMFLIYFTILMLDTKTFGELKAKGEVVAVPFADKKGKVWFWAGLVVSFLVSLIVYPTIYRWTVGALAKTIFTQLFSFYIGLWSLICAAASFIFTLIYYYAYGKKHGVDLRANGVIMSGKKWIKTIGLALLTVVAGYAIVFVADYLFHTDFRYSFVITIRAFDASHFSEIWKYFILFVPYYVMLSVATNCFNFVDFGNDKAGIKSAVIDIIAVDAAPVLMYAIQYISLLTTGYSWTELHTGGSLIGVWLVPIIVILPFAAFMSRKLYKKTRNPYIAGILMGVFVVVMTVTNQLCQI